MKNFKKIISFVLITTLMMTLVPAMGLSVMAAGADASGTITNVAFSDAVINNFSPDTFTYNIAVPVYYTSEDGVDAPKYKLPKIISYELADDTSDRAVVTDAKTVPGTAKIEVYHESELLNTYTFNLDYTGENMYDNGGAELGSWYIFNGNDVVHTTDHPALGTYCMDINFGRYYPNLNLTPASYEANKVYLASSMIRVDENDYSSYGTTMHKEEALDVTEGVTLTQKLWNADGTERPDGNGFVTPKDWTTHYRTYVLDNPGSFADVYTRWDAGWSQRDFYIDEYFMGELVANVKVKDENDAEEITIDVPTAELTRTLTAEMTNQLGNKAGLGTEAPEFTWELIGPSDDVKFNNGVVTIEANAEAGTYYISAVAQTGIAKGSYKINILDSVSLESLRITGAEDLDFSGANTSYSVAVPLLHVNEEDTYTMPKVEAKALFDDANIEYIYPETIPGDIKVIVTNGGASKTYTISLELVGENKYINGSLNDNTVAEGLKGWASGAIGLEAGSIDGTYDLYVNAYQGNPNGWLGQALTVGGEGKSYIHSNMVKKYDGAAVSERTDYLDAVAVHHDNKTGATPVWYDSEGNASSASLTLTDNWQQHISVYYNTIAEDNAFKNLYLDWGNLYRYAVNDYFMGELVIADIDINADTKCFKKSEEAQTVQLTATVLNNIGNVAGIKGKTTTAWRLGKNAPAGAFITDAGLVTIPGNYNGTFEIEAVATPTWAGAAQKSFVKAYEIAVGDAEIIHTATDDGVIVTVNYVGADECKLINAIYDIKVGEWIFNSAEAVEVNGNNLTIDIALSSKQGVKTFFWKWDDLTPVTKPYTFKK